MNLENIFLPTDTIDALDATSKRRVLSDIAAAMAASRGLDAKAVFDVLHERERLGSTAIGGGVAIPHAKIAGLTRHRRRRSSACISAPVTPVARSAQASRLARLP